MSNGPEHQRLYELEVSDDWLDRLARFNQHFGRFVRDAFGVLLIATALILFLALRGATQGVLLSPWVEPPCVVVWVGRLSCRHRDWIRWLCLTSTWNNAVTLGSTFCS